MAIKFDVGCSVSIFWLGIYFLQNNDFIFGLGAGQRNFTG